MRVAFLVLAARGAAVLERHVSLFTNSEFHFFVHIDKKSEDHEFRFLSGHKQATIVEERHKVFWGGFNMILAELALLRAAMDDQSFERFVLISDDAFALRPPADIFQSLTDDCIWIGQSDVSGHQVSARYHGYYFFDSDATNAQFRVPEQRAFLPDEFAHLRDLERLRGQGKKPLPRLFQGSQWWGLTRDVARRMLAVVDDDEHLRQSFRFSCIPDEHYFQTIIGLSDCACRNRGTPMYVDFSRDPKPYVFHDFADTWAPRRSDKLFIRKIGSDSALLDSLVAASS